VTALAAQIIGALAAAVEKSPRRQQSTLTAGLDANAAAGMQPVHGLSMCRTTSFKYTRQSSRDRELRRSECATFNVCRLPGSTGDPSVNLARKRLRKIDFDNRATAQWIDQVPTVADWLALIPTAAALDPSTVQTCLSFRQAER
jgi:hypothetical protein